jgi:hypothetical protein
VLKLGDHQCVEAVGGADPVQGAQPRHGLLLERLRLGWLGHVAAGRLETIRQSPPIRLGHRRDHLRRRAQRIAQR